MRGRSRSISSTVDSRPRSGSVSKPDRDSALVVAAAVVVVVVIVVVVVEVEVVDDDATGSDDRCSFCDGNCSAE